jgi:hypothetical protein
MTTWSVLNAAEHIYIYIYIYIYIMLLKQLTSILLCRHDTCCLLYNRYPGDWLSRELAEPGLKEVMVKEVAATPGEPSSWGL